MTIDWTQPVETTEDPPRPVRVLATDIDDTLHPVGVWYPDAWKMVRYRIDGCTGARFPTLRNVAPPKPAAKAVANVAETSCTTCRWFNSGFLPPSCKCCSVRGSGLQMNWVPRHD